MIQIFTDTSANLPTAMCNEYNITVLPLYYYIDGEEYTCLDTESFDGGAYYKSIKEGKQVPTSQITPGHFAEAFRTALAAGDDVIYVADGKVKLGSLISGVPMLYAVERTVGILTKDEIEE